MRVGWTVPASAATLTAALQGLTALDYVLLGRGSYPQLYRSGVRYQRERLGGPEDWQNVAEIFRRGTADCEDLAAARAAELRRLGVPARAVVIRVGPRQFHAVVDRGDGSYEDPSRRLGMR